MMILEQRSTAGVVEIRAGAGGKHIGGYALKWNTMSQNLGGFVEEIAPGAADKTLADGGDVLCRYQHEDEFLLGRTLAQTLALAVDNIGLDYDCALPATSYADDLTALVVRGDVRYSSFAFRTIEDEWGFTDQGFPLRRLIAFQLVDVAPVVTPGYMDTTAGLRSLAERRSLDLDVVKKAADAGALGDLLRAGAPAVIDLAAGIPARRDGGEPCGCCDTCVEADPEDCPGCDCVECRCGGVGMAPRSASHKAEISAPGATHGLISLRQRRAEFQRRTL